MRPHRGPFLSLALLTALATGLAASARAQDPVPTPEPAPSPATAPTPYTPADLARIASQRVDAVAQASSHYTYYETELNQQTMDGALVVNHTTVSESVFLGGLPYLHRLSVDGKPLEGKELAKEDKLYSDALRSRSSLDAATRARLTKTGNRDTSRTQLDQLAVYFRLAAGGPQPFDGRDCFVLDATPIPGLDVPSVQRHIRIALDAATLDLVDISIEFLADDGGFSKGTIIHTRYQQVEGVTLPAEKDFDTVIIFAELLNKPVKVHKVLTYTNYRRFRTTVTIQMAGDQPPPPEDPPAKSSKPQKTPKPPTPKPTPAAKPAPAAKSAPAAKPADPQSGGWFWQTKKPVPPPPPPPDTPASPPPAR